MALRLVGTTLERLEAEYQYANQECALLVHRITLLARNKTGHGGPELGEKNERIDKQQQRRFPAFHPPRFNVDELGQDEKRDANRQRPKRNQHDRRV